MNTFNITIDGKAVGATTTSTIEHEPTEEAAEVKAVDFGKHVVKIVSQDDETVTIGGYGVVFGGRDLDGDTFTKETDFQHELVPQKLVLYDHNMAEVKSALGTIKAEDIEEDEDGLWIQAQIDRSKAYAKEVIKLIEAGALGWSSGSVPHLVQRIGRTIKTWPIVEFSLTPTPAEPRTLGVDFIKQLASNEGLGSLEALIAEDGGTPSDESATEEQDTHTEAAELETSEVNQMSEQVQEQEVEEVEAFTETAEAQETKASDVDIAALIGQAVEKAFKAEKPATDGGVVKAVNYNKVTGLGDSEVKAMAHYYRTGDAGAISNLKASNATDMNIGTDADGGYAVPTGHHNEIVARRDEMRLSGPLGVRNIPGVGTTVNVPVDNEADGEFVSTAEAATFDLDAPAINQVAMTLVKYSKRIILSYELLQDEDSRLMAFLSDFVGRGLAKTHNSLLVTEALAGGTAALTLDGAAAITAAEIPELMYLLPGEYTDGAAWLMARATEGKIRGIQGNDIIFHTNGQGNPSELNGFPIYNSESMPAATTGLKSLVFGNFNFIGLREAPGLTVLRDPYTLANAGQVVFHYYFRAVYKTLQAEAVAYATQA